MKKVRLNLIIILLIFLSCNSIPIVSIEIEWQDDDQYTYGIHNEYYEELILYQADGEPAIDEFFEEWEGTFEITSIHNESKIIITIFRYDNETIMGWEHNYSMDEKIDEDLSSITGLFHFDYRYNEDLDKIVLRTLYEKSMSNDIDDCWNRHNFFLEPDWLNFNNAMKNNVLNESSIIDEVEAWGKTNQITLGDFLDSLPDYKINNQRTLEKAKEQFTVENTFISFYFDLSGVLFSEGIFAKKCKINFSLNYFDNGLLDRFESFIEFEFKDNRVNWKGKFEVVCVFGGIESLNLKFTVVAIFPVMLSLIVLIRRVQKKSTYKN